MEHAHLVLRLLRAAVCPWSRWCSSACRSRASRCFSASCHALKPLAVVRVRPNCYAVCACEAPAPSLSRSGTYMSTNLSRFRGPVKMDLAPSGPIVLRLPPHNLLASRYLFICSFVWLAALIFGRVEPIGEVPAPPSEYTRGSLVRDGSGLLLRRGHTCRFSRWYFCLLARCIRVLLLVLVLLGLPRQDVAADASTLDDGVARAGEYCSLLLLLREVWCSPAVVLPSLPLKS